MSLLKFFYDDENGWIKEIPAPVLPDDTQVSFLNTSGRRLDLDFSVADAFYGISHITIAPHSRVALNFSGAETCFSYGRAATGPDTIPPG